MDVVMMILVPAELLCNLLSYDFWTSFSKYPSFKTAMPRQAGDGRASGVGHRPKVICYFYSSVDYFHIW